MAAQLPKQFPPPTANGEIEIKQYPAYRAVTYTHQGDVKLATRAAFDALYRHISANQIAMTTPVEVRYYGADPMAGGTRDRSGSPQEKRADVSFLYPDATIAPAKVAPDVEVRDYPEIAVVSIGIQGAYTWDSYERHRDRLYRWLGENPQYRAIAPPRRLLYNSPMTPEALKQSEVQIAIALPSD
ncbi:heme-binding protein [Oxynema sp. CENA135]|uniref:heme-binding protein n=1 Tax=Oxynema sp. CENA135 TaxID=984206 RepID=UPI0019099E7A|nr:heme-binding protein [Oxynema sp. CENA135]MBK4728373.1 heme-binding protein [Oxynema sp. CENA135]